MKTRYKVLLVLAVLLPLFGFAAFNIYTAAYDPAPPASFEVVYDSPEPDCYTDDTGETYCTDAMVTPWEPYCEWSPEQWRTACYDYEGGEELCTVPDGPYVDEFGDPYYVAEWDYCYIQSWTGEEEVFGVHEDTAATVSGIIAPVAAKSILTRVFSGSQAERIAKTVKKVMDES